MDVTGAHCGEPWEVHGLRHDAVEYLSSHEGHLLAALGPVADVVAYLADTAGGEPDDDLDRLLADIGQGQPLSVPALFDYWSNAPGGPNDPHRQAAARVVNTAIYRGVLSGQGCPASDCGFDHHGEGEHAHRTAHEVTIGAVTDDDPTLFV